jgi:hypothetical protein
MMVTAGVAPFADVDRRSRRPYLFILPNSRVFSKGLARNSSAPRIRQSVFSCRPDKAVVTKMRALFSVGTASCASISLSAVRIEVSWSSVDSISTNSSSYGLPASIAFRKAISAEEPSWASSHPPILCKSIVASALLEGSLSATNIRTVCSSSYNLTHSPRADRNGKPSRESRQRKTVYNHIVRSIQGSRRLLFSNSNTSGSTIRLRWAKMRPGT